MTAPHDPCSHHRADPAAADAAARAVLDAATPAVTGPEHALRLWVAGGAHAQPGSPLAVMRWAAEEIDRLRAQRHAAYGLADEIQQWSATVDAIAADPGTVNGQQVVRVSHILRDVAARLRAALDTDPEETA